MASKSHVPKLDRGGEGGGWFSLRENLPLSNLDVNPQSSTKKFRTLGSPDCKLNASIEYNSPDVKPSKDIKSLIKQEDYKLSF